MCKGFFQTPPNIRTLLINNEIKYSRPSRRPARSASGLAGGLANIFLFEFWILFRQKVSSRAHLHTCVGPQRILEDMHFGARNALKFSALSNNPDFIKQSKADPDRIGAMPTIGATGTATCPVVAMWSYLEHTRPAPGGPLFVDRTATPPQYPSALRVLQMHIGSTGHLYGLHSFRVGSAQALALAGRSVSYIMGLIYVIATPICRYMLNLTSNQ